MSWRILIIRGARLTCNVAGCSRTAHVRCAFDQACQSLALSLDQCSFNRTGATLLDQVCSCEGLETGGGGVWGSLQPPQWDDVPVVNELELWWGVTLKQSNYLSPIGHNFCFRAGEACGGTFTRENMTGGAASRHVVPQEVLEYLTERYSGSNI